MERVTCLIPYLDGCPHREAALGWVRRRYEYPVRLAPGARPWCKAAALRPALEACPDGIVILADADVWTDGLSEAVCAVSEGASWARPFARVHRLTRAGTAALRAGEPLAGLEREEIHRGALGGGITVARRGLLLEVPMDPRFVGWGQEDEAFGCALRTLAGQPWRGSAELIHLWHPPQKRMSRRKGSVESWALYKRYAEARRNPGKMRDLLREIDDHRPDEPIGDDPAAHRIGDAQ